MQSKIQTTNVYYVWGISLCYLIFLGNLLIFTALIFIKLPIYHSVLLFEQHHLNIFLFILTSGCLLSKYKKRRFFRLIGWYAGFIIFLACLLLFIESVIYSNYITSYFDINEKTSPLTMISFMLIAFSLLDLSLMRTTKRIAIVAGLLVLISAIGILLNIMHSHLMVVMPLYSAINFILVAVSFFLLYIKCQELPSVIPLNIDHEQGHG